MKYFKRSIAFDESENGKMNWEQALGSYANYTSQIMSQLPANTQDYVTLTSYHDAELYSLEHDAEEKKVALRFCKHAALLYSQVEHLIYNGEDAISEEQSNTWLYDEVELLPDDRIEFRILLENGELTLRAKDVEIIDK